MSQSRVWGTSVSAALKTILARLLIKTALCKRLTIELNGFSMVFHPTAMSGALWVEPETYAADVDFLRHYIREGDRFIDVGANIGYYTILAAITSGPKGDVISIEPNPAIFNYLTANVSLNHLPNVKAHNVALGASAKGVYLHLHPKDDTQSSIGTEGDSPVSMVALDDLIEESSSHDLVKIDVEGYEKFVIEGGMKTLGRAQCVFIESWAQQYARYGTTCVEVNELLRDCGLEPYRRLGSHVITPCGPDYTSAKCENLIGIRDIDAFVARTGYSVSHQTA